MTDRPTHPARRLATALVTVGVLALTGCSAGGTQGASQSSDGGGKVRVVTSTNVYADLASQVGGDRVEVTPVIDSTAQDPHSYEASPQDRLAVEKADLVVRNGGGYDEFMSELSPQGQHVVDAVETSGLQSAEQEKAAEEHDHGPDGGHHHHHGGFNEHVWYDLDSMATLVDRIAQQLGEVDGQNTRVYAQNADRVKEELARLDERVEAIGASGGYLATEPVPGYLLQDAGLHDDTPAAFTEAVDAESDVPPAVLQETLDLVGDGHVAMVAFNKQTATGQTDKLRAAAQDAGTPVVEFTETVPDGTSYQQWMGENVDHVATALGK